MDWHVAVDTKDNLVVILVVPAAANGTASVILGKLYPLLKCDILDVSFQLLPFSDHLLVRYFHHVQLVHLVHDLAVSEFVPSLLRQLQLFQEINLELAWVIDVKQKEA